MANDCAVTMTRTAVVEGCQVQQLRSPTVCNCAVHHQHTTAAKPLSCSKQARHCPVQSRRMHISRHNPAMPQIISPTAPEAHKDTIFPTQATHSQSSKKAQQCTHNSTALTSVPWQMHTQPPRSCQLRCALPPALSGLQDCNALI